MVRPGEPGTLAKQVEKTFDVFSGARSTSGSFGLRTGKTVSPGPRKSVTELSRETQNQLRLDRLSETSSRLEIPSEQVFRGADMGRELPAATSVCDYGSEGWGFKSLRAR